MGTRLHGLCGRRKIDLTKLGVRRAFPRYLRRQRDTESDSNTERQVAETALQRLIEIESRLQQLGKE